ncbi:YgaP family membrane protein [Rosettibacter firmus]|uniref:YgaP family membrane protein n=1 Tax=Rosettibacter firmus TaxID=3111522 RepID=UPI00336BE4FD
MKKNIGSTDKILRVIIGILIIAIGLITKSWWGLIGLIPIATALIGWCPLYAPFGITTCKTQSEEQK